MLYYLISGVIFIDGQGNKEINERVGSKTPITDERGRQDIARAAVWKTLPDPNIVPKFQWVDGPHLQNYPKTN